MRALTGVIQVVHYALICTAIAALATSLVTPAHTRSACCRLILLQHGCRFYYSMAVDCLTVSLCDAQ
jgi:hypothetical protein